MDFSFIIPVYNCAAYLSDCVESIRAAKLPSYEILLVDDGSTDGSSSLCDELAAGIPQVKVIHQTNSGVSAARNKGLSHAIGTHILFVDADDSVDPDLLHHTLTDPRVQESDVTVFGLSFDYFFRKRCYRSDSLFFPDDRILTEEEWGNSLVSLFQHNSLSAMWNKVYKRSIIEEKDLTLNTSMFLYEDLEFVLRYLSCCSSIFNVPKAIYHYRQSEDEGNAGRRLSRIERIPTFLQPIEEALVHLRDANKAVSKDACERILQQLHLTLAREKIAVSDLKGIRKICREYAEWENCTISAPDNSIFRQQLLAESAVRLWLNHKKSHIRHRIAVLVKSTVHLHRKEVESHES